MGEARQVMDRITEAAFAENQEALKKLYAPDAVAETPDQGTLSGPDAVADWFGQFATAFPDASWESAHKHESGNVAIDEGWSVRTPAPWRCRTARASRRREKACACAGAMPRPWRAGW